MRPSIFGALFVALSFPGDLHAELTEEVWRVSCTLKEQSAIAMLDGRAQKSPLLTDDFQTGSEISIKFSFESINNQEKCWGSLVINIERFGVGPIFSAPFDTPCREVEYSNFNSNSINGTDSLISIDEINFSNGIGTLELFRYYRGDWHGFSFNTFRYSTGSYVGHLLALDCRGADAIFSEMYQYFQMRLD